LEPATDAGKPATRPLERADAVGFYAKYGFIPVEVVEGQSDSRPARTPMFLAMRAIRQAIGTDAG
jgi:hypothetical protein